MRKEGDGEITAVPEDVQLLETPAPTQQLGLSRVVTLTRFLETLQDGHLDSPNGYSPHASAISDLTDLNSESVQQWMSELHAIEKQQQDILAKVGSHQAAIRSAPPKPAPAAPAPEGGVKANAGMNGFRTASDLLQLNFADDDDGGADRQTAAEQVQQQEQVAAMGQQPMAWCMTPYGMMPTMWPQMGVMPGPAIQAPGGQLFYPHGMGGFQPFPSFPLMPNTGALSHGPWPLMPQAAQLQHPQPLQQQLQHHPQPQQQLQPPQQLQQQPPPEPPVTSQQPAAAEQLPTSDTAPSRVAVTQVDAGKPAPRASLDHSVKGGQAASSSGGKRHNEAASSGVGSRASSVEALVAAIGDLSKKQSQIAGMIGQMSGQGQIGVYQAGTHHSSEAYAQQGGLLLPKEKLQGVAEVDDDAMSNPDSPISQRPPTPWGNKPYIDIDYKFAQRGRPAPSSASAVALRQRSDAAPFTAALFVAYISAFVFYMAVRWMQVGNVPRHTWFAVLLLLAEVAGGLLTLLLGGRGLWVARQPLFVDSQGAVAEAAAGHSGCQAGRGEGGVVETCSEDGSADAELGGAQEVVVGAGQPHFGGSHGPVSEGAEERGKWEQEAGLEPGSEDAAVEADAGGIGDRREEVERGGSQGGGSPLGCGGEDMVSEIAERERINSFMSDVAEIAKREQLNIDYEEASEPERPYIRRSAGARIPLRPTVAARMRDPQGVVGGGRRMSSPGRESARALLQPIAAARPSDVEGPRKGALGVAPTMGRMTPRVNHEGHAQEVAGGGGAHGETKVEGWVDPLVRGMTIRVPNKGVNWDDVAGCNGQITKPGRVDTWVPVFRVLVYCGDESVGVVQECVDALLAQNVPEVELHVYLVDDLSDVTRMAAACSYPSGQVHYIPVQPPATPMSPLYLRTHALNIALDEILPRAALLGDHEYVLLLDADAVVQPGAIGKLAYAVTHVSGPSKLHVVQFPVLLQDVGPAADVLDQGSVFLYTTLLERLQAHHVYPLGPTCVLISSLYLQQLGWIPRSTTGLDWLLGQRCTTQPPRYFYMKDALVLHTTPVTDLGEIFADHLVRYSGHLRISLGWNSPLITRSLNLWQRALYAAPACHALTSAFTTPVWLAAPILYFLAGAPPAEPTRLLGVAYTTHYATMAALLLLPSPPDFVGAWHAYLAHRIQFLTNMWAVASTILYGAGLLNEKPPHRRQQPEDAAATLTLRTEDQAASLGATDEEPSILLQLLLHVVVATSQLLCVAGGFWLLTHRGIDSDAEWVTLLQENAEVVVMVLLAAYNTVPSATLLLVPLGRALGAVSVVSALGMVASLACVVLSAAVVLLLPWGGRGSGEGEQPTLLEELRGLG